MRLLLRSLRISSSSSSTRSTSTSIASFIRYQGHPLLRSNCSQQSRVQPRHLRATMATMTAPASSHQYSMKTSGETDAVWVHTEPYSNRPQFSRLSHDLEVDVCIIGAGIAGISSAYELVKRGTKVALIEAREVLSGESGRTSGHLSYSLDDGFAAIASKHGQESARMAALSHAWAIKHVGEVSRELGIDCEFRLVNDYEISQYEKGTPEHAKEIKMLKEDVEKIVEFGLPASFQEGFTIKGWDGRVDQRDVAVYGEQGAFHPTRYLVGLLRWLAQQPNFECYTHTRMISIEEKGLVTKKVHVGTLDGHTITCNNAIEATCIPLQKLSIVAQLEYYRTYCIAIRVPKGSVEDCLINDQADPYNYIRFTACDDRDVYMIVGGYDHKVGQETVDDRYARLEAWVRQRFTQAGSVDYKWSGQILNSADMVHFIGLNQGNKHIYIVTGDTGHGLTQGVIASRLLADEIHGVENPWSKVYSPKRLPPLTTLPSMLAHDVQINAQYKRFLQTDIHDIEDLAPGTGGVLNTKLTKKPLAVYKDDDGRVHKFSAVCPHLHGVVCWNPAEKSFDCPVHGSRFGKDGVCIMGPAKSGLAPENELGGAAQQQAVAS